MKTNNVLVMLVILFALVIVSVVAYIGIEYFKNGKSIQEEGVLANYNNVIEELDIDSGFVQGLYMYIKDDNRCWNTPFQNEEFELDANDIPYNTKFIMALQITLDDDMYQMDCNKYQPTRYFDVASLNGGSCGINNYYDSATNTYKSYLYSAAYTTVLKETSIKLRMNQIFGPDTYYQVDSVNHASLVYKYIPEEQGYVTLSIPAGGTCVGHSNELTSAVKNDKEVILTVKKTTGENGDIIYNYEYTFTLNESDDSYYLTHISSKLA